MLHKFVVQLLWGFIEHWIQAFFLFGISTSNNSVEIFCSPVFIGVFFSQLQSLIYWLLYHTIKFPQLPWCQKIPHKGAHNNFSGVWGCKKSHSHNLVFYRPCGETAPGTPGFIFCFSKAQDKHLLVSFSSHCVVLSRLLAPRRRSRHVIVHLKRVTILLMNIEKCLPEDLSLFSLPMQLFHIGERNLRWAEPRLQNLGREEIHADRCN